MNKDYLANGIETDGIKYEVYLEKSKLICNVTFGEKKLTEEWPINYLPRAGWYVSDVQQAEIVMEKLITEMREIKD